MDYECDRELSLLMTWWTAISSHQCVCGPRLSHRCILGRCLSTHQTCRPSPCTSPVDQTSSLRLPAACMLVLNTEKFPLLRCTGPPSDRSVTVTDTTTTVTCAEAHTITADDNNDLICTGPNYRRDIIRLDLV